MDFIFDRFVELECYDGNKYYVSMANIISVNTRTVDLCDVRLSDGDGINAVKMPARVLVQKIAQRRQEAQKLLCLAVTK